jgi:hypothetical protein
MYLNIVLFKSVRQFTVSLLCDCPVAKKVKRRWCDVFCKRK